MPYSVTDTLTTQHTLEAAIDAGDHAAFTSSYLDFLKRFAAFHENYSQTPTEVQSHNPIFGRKGFYLRQTNDAQARDLIASARKASTVLGSLPIADRLALLNLLEAKIDLYQEAIMLTVTADTGKPIELARGEMTKGREWFAFARDEAQKQLGHKTVGKLLNRHKPQGAVQVIGAYNYPYALAISGIVGALAAGNGVIVSAPLKAPNWIFPFMAAAQEAIGDFVAHANAAKKPFAEALAQNASAFIQHSLGVNQLLTKQADVVHFVGGDKTGELIRKARGRKPSILEMSATNVVTVMASALKKTSAETIAQTIYAGFGPATGQRCTAPRILITQTGAEAVITAMNALIIQGPKPEELGNPFKKSAKIGPLVDRSAHQQMKDAMALSLRLGATVHGVFEVDHATVPFATAQDSYWVNPIVIDWSGVDRQNPDTERRMIQCVREEIFGPLLHILPPFTMLADAVRLTNLLDHRGLAASLFTSDPADVEQFAAAVHATSLAINGAPKDQSPRGAHGHPGMATIGGDNHFGLYARRVTQADMTVKL